LEGLWSDCLIVERDGHVVEYDGPLAKRGRISGGAFECIGSGGSFSREIRLGRFYEMNRSGSYRVQLSLELDCLQSISELTEMNGEVRLDNLVGYRRELVEAETCFTIDEDQEDLQTAGQSIRAIDDNKSAVGTGKGFQKINEGTLIDPIISSDVHDTTQRQMIAEAHSNSFKLSQNAIDLLSSLATQSDNVLYCKWFGSGLEGGPSTVMSVFKAIRSRMQTTSFTYNLGVADYAGGIYAYTYFKTSTIWICSGFWSANPRGVNSQAGTILHEHSHADADIRDVRYGYDNCRDLANDTPSGALQNADNYEYFAEETE